MKTKINIIGKVKYTQYIFEEKNDILPLHTHTEEDVHFTIVAKGSFEMSGPSFDSQIITSGQVIDWEPGTFHEFKALESGSKLINIWKNYTG